MATAFFAGFLATAFFAIFLATAFFATFLAAGFFAAGALATLATAFFLAVFLALGFAFALAASAFTLAAAFFSADLILAASFFAAALTFLAFLAARTLVQRCSNFLTAAARSEVTFACSLASKSTRPALAVASAAARESATCAKRKTLLAAFTSFCIVLNLALVVLKSLRAAISALFVAGEALAANFAFAPAIFVRVEANFVAWVVSLACTAVTFTPAFCAAVILTTFLAGALDAIFFLAGFFTLTLRGLANFKAYKR